MIGWDAETVTRDGLQALVRVGLLEQGDWDRVGRDARGGAAVEALIAEGLVTEEQVAQAVADAMGVPYVFPHPGACDLDLCDAVSPDLLRRHRALPLVRDGADVVVAFAEPPTTAEVAALAQAFSASVAPVLATRRKLERALEAILPGPPPVWTAGSPPAFGDGCAPDPAALTVLFGALARAVARGACEVRFEPRDGEILVRERGAEGLREVGRVPRSAATALCQRARILAGAAAGERGPVGPRWVDTRIGGKSTRLRVTVREGDPRGPAVLLSIRGAAPPSDLAGYRIPSQLRDRLVSVLAGRTGLVLATSWAAAVARALGRAFAEAACAQTDGALVAVDSELSPEESTPLYLASELAAAIALEPDVLLVATLGPDEPLASLLRYAQRARVVLVAADAEPLDAILGLLEGGARPSLLARVLELSAAVDGDAPYRVRALRPGAEARAWLAVGDRSGFCARLPGDAPWI